MRIRDRLYYYNIELIRVIDGDTIVAHLDRGHNRWEKEVHIRLSSINAPEMKGESKPQGEEAKQYLISLIGTDRPLYIRTIKSDNFCRFIGHLYIEDVEHDEDIDANAVMVETGHAVPFMVEINL